MEQRILVLDMLPLRAQGPSVESMEKLADGVRQMGVVAGPLRGELKAMGEDMDWAKRVWESCAWMLFVTPGEMICMWWRKTYLESSEL